MEMTRFRYPIWSRGDLDGFFGLMVDNLVQVLMIIFLCTQLCGMPESTVFQRVLPGVAISLLLGNLFYGAQAHYVARRDRNAACTALPYGINTPSVFAFILFIMRPVYEQYAPSLGPAAAADLAWKAGLVACMVSGIIEFLAAFVAERLRRVTPRAALLGVLAGIGIAFIASDFAFRIYTRPLVGILPLAVLLLAYFAHFRFAFHLPGGFLAVLLGASIAWLISAPQVAAWLGATPLLHVDAVQRAWESRGWIAPYFCGRELLEVLGQGDLIWRFLTISIPMGVINALGSLQNIESAEAGGDRFATAPSLAVNGLGTLAAGLFGSCFPTTIYIGHPGWKALGARAGYSILNGLFFTVCFLYGLGALLGAVIPIEAGAAIVMYIGIVITAQAFQATPRAHAPAVAIALFPAMAALLIVNLPLFMADAGATRGLGEMLTRAAGGAGAQVPTLPGMVSLMGANSSWFVVTLFLAAIGSALIDRNYKAAATWSGAAAILTALGVLHAYRVESNNDVRECFVWQRFEVRSAAAPTASATEPANLGATHAVYLDRAYPIAAGYALATVVFSLAAVSQRGRREEPPGAQGGTDPIADESDGREL